MKDKINIAELLKNCPKGMELYSTIYGTVYFEGVRDTGYATLIDVTAFDNTKAHFYPNGKFNTYYSDSEMTLFPSKNVRTWEGFQRPFVDGDIVSTTTGSFIGITKGGKRSCFIPTYCVIKGNGEFEAYFNRKENWTFERLATEEEKQKLFKAIKANGYKWNKENKTLEKLIVPKFKVGDRIQSIRVNLGNIYNIIEVKESSYVVNKHNENSNFHIDFEIQDDWELVPNKFNITTLKPFDKVLVRNNNEQKWTIDYFSFVDKEEIYPFICVGHYAGQCIPYEGNEHLLGTTNDCDEYFKIWEYWI